MRIKHDKYNVVAVPQGIAKELLQVKGWDVNQTISETGEVWIDFFARTQLSQMGGQINDFRAAFEYLELKTEAVRKTISFWDAYQIKGVITDVDTMDSTISQLPANSSVIANTGGLWYNALTQKNENYFQGDIFVKDYYNNIYHIPLISSGYYYPEKIQATSGTTYTLTYRYTTNQPNNDSITKAVGQDVTEPANDIIFTGISTAADEGGYNASYTISSGGVQTFSKIGNIVPVVKTYTSSNEQVFNGHTLALSSGTYTITNVSSIELYVTVR